MGLDMYLTGKKFLWTNWEDPKQNLVEDGFKIQYKYLEIGYWRKHPDLHGYIVTNFAKGVDECQEIPLSVEDLEKILKASEARELPTTAGFFFGVSHADDYPETKKILKAAIKWLKTKSKTESRSIVYRASW